MGDLLGPIGCDSIKFVDTFASDSRGTQRWASGVARGLAGDQRIGYEVFGRRLDVRGFCTNDGQGVATVFVILDTQHNNAINALGVFQDADNAVTSMMAPGTRDRYIVLHSEMFALGSSGCITSAVNTTAVPFEFSVDLDMLSFRYIGDTAAGFEHVSNALFVTTQFTDLSGATSAYAATYRTRFHFCESF